jgi:hypothetical protein
MDIGLSMQKRLYSLCIFTTLEIHVQIDGQIDRFIDRGIDFSTHAHTHTLFKKPFSFHTVL